MECEAREVSESWGLVGGIVTGGGAWPYKARAAVRCTQYPLAKGMGERIPGEGRTRAEGVSGRGEGAGPEGADGHGRSAITEEARTSGAGKRGAYPMSARGRAARKPADSSARRPPRSQAGRADAEGGKSV